MPGRRRSSDPEIGEHEDNTSTTEETTTFFEYGQRGRRSSMKSRSRSFDSTCSKSVTFSLPPPEPQNNFRENEKRMKELEDAAKRIQNGVRRRSSLQEKKNESEPGSSALDDDEDDGDSRIPEQEKKDREPLYRVVYLAAYALGLIALRFIYECFSCCGSKEPEPKQAGKEIEEITVDGGDDRGPSSRKGPASRKGPSSDPTVPASTNAAASKAMATQAAVSVNKGMASGISAGIAAASGTAITTAHVVAIMIVITVTLVGSSVVVAPILFPSPPESIPSISACGSETPVYHDGTIGLVFEGVDQAVDLREQQLMEVLVVDSYNLVTIDPSLGCVDEYLREMQNSTMIDQTLSSSSDDGSMLEMTFAGWLMCDGCPDQLPMYSRFANGSSDPSQQPDDFTEIVAIDQQLVEQSLKRLATRIVELVESGELRASLIPTNIIAKVPQVMLNDGSILGNEGGDEAGVANETVLLNLRLIVTYDEEDGYSVTFDVDALTDSPTAYVIFTLPPANKPSLAPNKAIQSSFPSVESALDIPSSMPTDSPSSSPSARPSASPTIRPSPGQSDIVGGTPTETPSGVPTESPSDSMNNIQTGAPSGGPKSSSPTERPSSQVSNGPVGNPTNTPSISPVAVGNPTASPGIGATPVPTKAPTDSPSVGPTTTSPSPGPTGTPSASPTDTPSAFPSPAPSTPEPSQNPSEMPSTQYIGCFSDTPAMELSIGAGPYTVASCQSDCNDFGYIHSGLQPSAVNGNQCFCGDSYVSGNQVADSLCNNDCSGSCGGTDRNSVWRTGNSVGGGFSYAPGMYCGCHDDNPGARDLDVRISEYMSVKGCIAGCSNNGYKYAGLQNNRECWCGDSVSGATNGGGCTTSCVFGAPPGCLGGGVCYCGATDINAIYRTSTSYPCP